MSAPHVPTFVPPVSLFAQLLAQENITVQINPKISTPNFNMTTRLLQLPSYAGFDEAAWVFFVSHEVGHSLFTPRDATTCDAFKSLLERHGPFAHHVWNLVEDVRVERLIRKKYQGLSGVFARGYLELMEKDFFKCGVPLTKAKWASYNSIDRLNLYTKMGALLGVELLRQREQEWANAAIACETHDDVLALTESILTVLRQPKQAPPPPQQKKSSDAAPSDGDRSSSEKSSDESSDESGESSDGDESDESSDESGESSDESGESSDESDDDGDESDDDGDESDDDGDESDDGGGEFSGDDSDASTTKSSDAGDGDAPNNPDDELKSETLDAAQQSLHDAAKQDSRYDRQSDAREILFMPVVTEEFHRNDVDFATFVGAWAAADADRDWAIDVVKQVKAAQSSVLTTMVESFRANQAAWMQRHVQTGRSGLLDPMRLSQYKLTDDVFLRRRAVPKGQNHGLVLNIDMSGSMQTNMGVVLWQVLHMLWFAERVNIPVEVWGFSDSGQSTSAYKIFASANRSVASADYTKARLVNLYRSDAPLALRTQGQAHLLALLLEYSFAAVNMASGGASYTTHYGVSRIPLPLQSFVLAQKNRWPSQYATRPFFTNMFFSLGGTPLHQALYSTIDVVREFRTRHRIEQCTSVWLTDGGDTYGIQIEGQPNVRLARVIVDPRTGKMFPVKNEKMMSALLSMHRTLTGALTVVVDMSDTPDETFRRVLGERTDLQALTNRIAPATHGQIVVPPLRPSKAKTTAGRRAADKRRRKHDALVASAEKMRPMIVAPSKTTIHIPTPFFVEAGQMSATLAEFPELGADLMIVTHPDWWTVTDVTQVYTKSRQKMEKMLSGIFVETIDEYGVPRHSRRSIAVGTVLMKQTNHEAIRKFTGLLIPFLAQGRR